MSTHGQTVIKEAQLKFINEHMGITASGIASRNGSNTNSTVKKQPKKSVNTLVGNLSHHHNKKKQATPAPQPQKRTQVIRSKSNRARNNMKENNAMIPSLTSAPKSKPMSRHLHTVIQYLLERKFKELPTMTIDEIIRDTHIDMKPLEASDMLAGNPKIHFENGRYSYQGMYNINNKNDLLELIAHSSGGILLNNLKDCYAQVEADVKALVAERKIFSIKNADIGTDVLFYNNQVYSIHINEEFKKMWHDIKVPDEIDLQNRLKDLGIKSQGDIDELNASATKKRKPTEAKKSKKQKKAKVLTNTHLKELIDSKMDNTQDNDNMK